MPYFFFFLYRKEGSSVAKITKNSNIKIHLTPKKKMNETKRDFFFHRTSRKQPHHTPHILATCFTASNLCKRRLTLPLLQQFLLQRG